MELTGEPARDDSRVNYSFDYDSGVVSIVSKLEDTHICGCFELST